jgi:hypothetical protein
MTIWHLVRFGSTFAIQRKEKKLRYFFFYKMIWLLKIEIDKDGWCNIRWQCTRRAVVADELSVEEHSDARLSERKDKFVICRVWENYRRT